MDERPRSFPDLLALAGGILLIVGVTRPWFSIPGSEDFPPFFLGGIGAAVDHWRGLPALAGGALVLVVALGSLAGRFSPRIASLLLGCGVAIGLAALLFGLDLRTAPNPELFDAEVDPTADPLNLAIGFWISGAGVVASLAAALAKLVPRRNRSHRSAGSWQDSAPPA